MARGEGCQPPPHRGSSIRSHMPKFIHRCENHTHIFAYIYMFMYIQWFFFLSTHFCALHRLRVNSMSVQFSCSFSAHQHLLHTAPSPHGSPGSPNIRGISPGRHHSHGRSQRLNNFSLIFPVASRHPRISYFTKMILQRSRYFIPFQSSSCHRKPWF